MIAGLDSATPPTADQVAAARAGGVRLWSGYLATQGQGGSAFGLLRVWTRAEFEVARGAGSPPIAYASGWDDPAGCRDLAAAWGVRLCLDVEDGIRGDGPWVDEWLRISGAGLYGACGVHSGRSAAFHVLAWYPFVPPAATWNDAGCPPRPAGPCGWQSRGSHPGPGAVDVDSGWYDDWFGGEMDEATFKQWVRDVLNEGTGQGQNTWAGTSQATLATVQGMVNQLNDLAALVAKGVPVASHDHPLAGNTGPSQSV